MGDNDNDGVLGNIEGEGAFCSACHVADWTMVADYGPTVVSPKWAPEGWVPPVFTDFSFDNLGTPPNPDHPNPSFVDTGLGGNLKDLGYPEDIYMPECGKVKVMTLRNIADTPPYLHNGVFATLEEVVHFYNTRDVPSEMWPDPEVAENVNTDELGNLGLSPADEAALVAFMKTLSDGYKD
jgi:cytochrome c peroxidase